MVERTTSDTPTPGKPMPPKQGVVFTVVAAGAFILLLVFLVNLSRQYFDFPSPPAAPDQTEIADYEGWQRQSFLVKGLQAMPELRTVPVVSSPALVHRLKEFDLWEISPNSAVSPIVFDRYPDELASMPVAERKKIFFHTLLPAALIVQTEIALEKRRLERIIRTFRDQLATLVFDFEQTEWQHGVSSNDLKFLNELVQRYRTDKAKELLFRVDVIPISIVLAQGALESSWGSSRFARQGNNIFGMWTWRHEGMIPNRRDQDKTHKVAIYPSLIDSVRTHSRTLNIGESYNTFRNIRKATLDPFQLASGLVSYAERGQEYVEDIKKVIRVNNLKIYDTCYLNSKI